MKGKLFFWIYPPIIVFFLISIITLTVFTTQSITNFFHDLSSFQLRQTVLVTANSLEPLLHSEGPEGLSHNRGKIQEYCDSLVRGSKIRLTVITSDGVVLADTSADPARMELHHNRSEIIDALQFGTGFATRTSVSTGITTTYEAHALRDKDGVVYAFLRTAIPFGVIDERRTELVVRILFFGALSVLLVSLFSLYITRRLTRPIARINTVAQSFSDGWFSERIPEEGPEEIKSLASVMNRMAVQLDDRISTINQERNKVQTILQGMNEAVAVVSRNLELVLTNRSFDSLFESRDESGAHTLLMATHSTELCDFMEAAIRAAGPLETSLTLYNPVLRYIRAAVAPLPDGMSVLVISDLTRMHRLETIRRDFTANVSHELKTPITAIKASLETMQDASCPHDEQCSRFLDMAVRGTNRLEAILEDLLSLARIEEEERNGLSFELVHLDDLIQTIQMELSGRMNDAGIVFERKGTTGIRLQAHSGLLRQAVFNLVDNAIKYGASGGLVQVTTEKRANQVVISIADRGPGISERDRSRLFERFYRVDKARSRETGGTGLGLAIVKHIARAHGGTVFLADKPDSGSQFVLEIPLSGRTSGK